MRSSQYFEMPWSKKECKGQKRMKSEALPSLARQKVVDLAFLEAKLI